MLDPDLSLPADYLWQIDARLREFGVDPAVWFAAAGLDAASQRELGCGAAQSGPSASADPQLRVPLAKFVRLVQAALQTSGEPALGLLVGERLLAHTHGVLGGALLQARSLREALALLERFMALRMPLITLSPQHHGDEVRVCFVEAWPLGELQRPLLESTLLSVRNLLDALTLGASRAGSVAFAFEAPEYARLARELLRSPVRYGQQWTGFSLPIHVLDAPLKQADPAAFEEAARSCQRALDRLDADASLSVRVQRLLLQAPAGLPSLQASARRLRLSPRTLHRRLVEQGTSFRQLLDEVRHSLALAQLRSGRSSIEAIAYRLGYTDSANFRRAFKRWQGVAPGQWRRVCAGVPAGTGVEARQAALGDGDASKSVDLPIAPD